MVAAPAIYVPARGDAIWISRSGAPPRALDPVFVEIFQGLAQHGKLARFRVLGGHLLVALDGTQYFSSTAMHCHNGLRRHTPNGHTLYDHTAITPVVVCSGTSQVLSLPPAYSMPQDGHDKQDCERAAGKRWISTHAQHDDH